MLPAHRHDDAGADVRRHDAPRLHDLGGSRRMRTGPAPRPPVGRCEGRGRTGCERRVPERIGAPRCPCWAARLGLATPVLTAKEGGSYVGSRGSRVSRVSWRGRLASAAGRRSLGVDMAHSAHAVAHPTAGDLEDLRRVQRPGHGWCGRLEVRKRKKMESRKEKRRWNQGKRKGKMLFEV